MKSQTKNSRDFSGKFRFPTLRAGFMYLIRYLIGQWIVRLASVITLVMILLHSIENCFVSLDTIISSSDLNETSIKLIWKFNTYKAFFNLLQRYLEAMTPAISFWNDQWWMRIIIYNQNCIYAPAFEIKLGSFDQLKLIAM